jgi:hypothetical protein
MALVQISPPPGFRFHGTDLESEGRWRGGGRVLSGTQNGWGQAGASSGGGSGGAAGAAISGSYASLTNNGTLFGAVG